MKRNITMRTLAAGADYILLADKSYDVDGDLAKSLVDGGYAAYTNGQPAAKSRTAPPPPPSADGPDFIIDWGRAHKGKRMGDIPDEYLLSLTKGRNPKERKERAVVEIERRKGIAPSPPVEKRIRRTGKPG